MPVPPALVSINSQRPIQPRLGIAIESAQRAEAFTRRAIEFKLAPFSKGDYACTRKQPTHSRILNRGTAME